MKKETRKKISVAMSGRHVSDETRALMSAARMGKPLPPETRAKIAAAHRKPASALRSNKVSLRLTPEAIAALDAACAREEKSRSQLIEGWITRRGVR